MRESECRWLRAKCDLEGLRMLIRVLTHLAVGRHDLAGWGLIRGAIGGDQYEASNRKLVSDGKYNRHSRYGRVPKFPSDPAITAIAKSLRVFCNGVTRTLTRGRWDRDIRGSPGE
jgi:hypothetical protein